MGVVEEDEGGRKYTWRIFVLFRLCYYRHKSLGTFCFVLFESSQF